MNGEPAWIRLADRYTRLRWVGITLYVVALCVFPLRLVLVYRGVLHPLPGVFPNIAALGISLGAFGSANDTALFALRQLDGVGKVPVRHTAELAQERARRADRLESTLNTPNVAFILPVVAALLTGWLSYTTLNGYVS